MIVDHFSFSTNGGAGIVASLLLKGQVALGVDAQLNTITDSNLWDAPWSHPSLTIRAAIDKYIIASSLDGPMFSLARRGARSWGYKPRPRAIIHLHWTEGLFRRERVLDWLVAGHNVVFTLHDMSPFTGGCHQSLGCKGFEVSCHSCPQTRPLFRPAVESKFARLGEFLEFKDQIAVVAPSPWMQSQALRSRHLSKLKVTVIENPIDPIFFQNFDRDQLRQQLQIPQGVFVACAIASQVNNPAKRIKDCLKFFSMACEEAETSGVFFLVGEGSEELAKQYPIAVSMGSGGPEHVARVLAASDVLLSGSKAESAGMTIREAMAQGVPSVVVYNGGSDHILNNAEVGHVVKDFEEMKLILTHLMLSRSRSASMELNQRLRKIAAANSGLATVSRKYTNLYRDFDSTGVAR